MPPYEMFRAQMPVIHPPEGPAGRWIRALLRGAVRAYQWFVSPVLGPRCRFLPTCSHYSLEAFETHGLRCGLKLTARRLSRCHPWGSSGYDPVPEPADCARCARPAAGWLTRGAPGGWPADRSRAD